MLTCYNFMKVLIFPFARCGAVCKQRSKYFQRNKFYFGEQLRKFWYLRYPRIKSFFFNYFKISTYVTINIWLVSTISAEIIFMFIQVPKTNGVVAGTRDERTWRYGAVFDIRVCFHTPNASAMVQVWVRFTNLKKKVRY